jgi:LysM repeat protein
MVSDCNDFYYVEVGDSCASIAAVNGITTAQLLEWNPTVGSNCAGLWADAYVCVGLIGEPTPSPTPTPTTTTPPGNGIPTASPTQPGMVDDCDEFYFVEIGDSCAAIALEHGISQSQLRDWNPSVGTDCSGLWANSYVCVSVIGHNPGATTTTTTTTTPPAPTTPPNGIETPLPIQPGMVDNCDAFHFVQQGETCTTIAAIYKISLTQFTTWNPTVGSTCNGIWANAYVCVSIIGHTPNPTTTTTTTTVPPPTTTAPSPSPTQSGLVKTCTSFYKAQAGDTCQTIAQQKYPYINSLTLFTRWNPAVGSNCNNLLPGYYYCVATELHQPMPGIISTCKRYYQVKAGDTCWSIQQQYGITATQFNRWNPRVGSSCSSLWERYFICIGV